MPVRLQLFVSSLESQWKGKKGSLGEKTHSRKKTIHLSNGYSIGIINGGAPGDSNDALRPLGRIIPSHITIHRLTLILVATGIKVKPTELELYISPLGPLRCHNQRILQLTTHLRRSRGTCLRTFDVSNCAPELSHISISTERLLESSRQPQYSLT